MLYYIYITFNKEEKSMKRIYKIITVLLIIAMVGMFTYGCKKIILATAENPFALKGLGVRPEGVKISPMDVNVEGEKAIKLAVEIYELACSYDKMADCRGYFSVCPTSNIAAKMNNKVLLNILEIKSGNEYYRIDYRLKDDIPIFTAMPYAEKPINESIRLVTTERIYMKTDMDYTRYQIVTNANTDEKGIPYADWSDKMEEFTDPNKQPSKPRVFSNSQQGDYRKSEHIIEEDTVKSATVTYNEAGGYYTVTMELNCEIDENGYNKATLNTRPLIQDGSGADNAKYDDITIEFEMWDNGYFKQFKSTENWSAKLKLFGIEVSSNFLYVDMYTYDPDDCVISKYYKDGNFVDDYNQSK